MRRSRRTLAGTHLGGVIAVAVCLCGSAFGAAPTTGPVRIGTAPEGPTPSNISPEDKARVTASLGRLPLLFVENGGQLDERVAYAVQGKRTSLYFTPEGVTFALSIPAKEPSALPKGRLHKTSLGPAPQRWALKLDFLGANKDSRPRGEDPQPARISYFKGQRKDWKTGLKTYAKVRYPELWPGIDLVYSGTVDRLKYQFEVRPGADPRQIRLAFRGASDLERTAGGELAVSTPIGGFTDARPVAYQIVDGRRVVVTAEYALKPVERERHGYGFALGPYDRSLPLVLDPAVLAYCGYIGGSGNELGWHIAVDTAGNAYVAGTTDSTEASFPVTAGPDLTHNGGYLDAFVAKVAADGSHLVYAGYIGGSGWDVVGHSAFQDDGGIAVDADGNAYVTGYTGSDETSFPVTVGPDLTHNGGWDAFVAKVSADGNQLDYAGYIGGTNDDFPAGIAVDAAGNAYVTGSTDSTEASFPVTVGPDLTHNGSDVYYAFDAFVAKVAADGGRLEYAGYIGGNGSDYGKGVAVDAAGDAYVTGTTDSTETSFPVTLGPDLTYNGGLYDAFVAKVAADGSQLGYAGYIGGSSYDDGYDITVDAAGNAYVTGVTDSTEASFPVTAGPDLTHNGGWDAFVAKVATDGSQLDYAGYIGGSGSDLGIGIAVDTAGNAYVTGTTVSTETSFPVSGGLDRTYNGLSDAFVAKVATDGSQLDYAGYIGGSSYDDSYDIAVDSNGNAYVTGSTDSTEASFPVTLGPDLTYNGNGDAFVAKIGDSSVSGYNLIVEVTGNGTVASGDGNIGCGTDCQEVYPEGTQVTLEATPDPGFIFDGWADACSGTGVCDLEMTDDKPVSATFSSADCPVEVVTAKEGGADDLLSLAYAVRDRLLPNVSGGEWMVDAYYRHGTEVGQRLLSDRSLRRQAMVLLKRLKPRLQTALEGSKLQLDAVDRWAIKLFVHRLQRGASDDLRADLKTFLEIF